MNKCEFRRTQSRHSHDPWRHDTPEDTPSNDEQETGYKCREYISTNRNVDIHRYPGTRMALVITTQQNMLSNGEKETGYNVYVKNI